jgi:streptomycin 6-kinase
MVKESETWHDAPGAQLLAWPDGGGVALITWHTAAGEIYQQETASRQEAKELLAKIGSNDELSLVSAQVRRAGIGPDS